MSLNIITSQHFRMIANNFIRLFFYDYYFTFSVHCVYFYCIISLFWFFFHPYIVGSYFILLDLLINKYQVTFANANTFPMHFVFVYFNCTLCVCVFMLIHFIYSMRYFVSNFFSHFTFFVVFFCLLSPLIYCTTKGLERQWENGFKVIYVFCGLNKRNVNELSDEVKPNRE